MENLKLKVITSYKLADALICQSLEKQFPDLEIIRYKISLKEQRKWYYKKLMKEGLWRSIGIKLMGMYLGFGNIYNLLINRTVWQKQNLPLPDWKDVHATIYNCSSENYLFELVKDADCVIALDTLRLPQKFFHQVKAPFLQAVYGVVPFYTGHMGVFWAYANHDLEKAGISIIQRGRYFNVSIILKTANISFSNNETLRSLRTKCALKIAEILPAVLKIYMANNMASYPDILSTSKNCCTTPTLYFYLKFRLQNTLSHWLSTANKPNNKPCSA